MVPSGLYRLGDGGERMVKVDELLIGRWPVTTAEFGAFVASAAYPVGAFLGPAPRVRAARRSPGDRRHVRRCGGVLRVGGRELGRPVRLPSGDEWEAAARGADSRSWPWGDTFDPERCNCVESAWGWTVPVGAHPAGAAASGAEQMAGNVWEWVGDSRDDDGWRTVRGGSYLDTSWGVRAARALAADPERPTATTGFRIAIDSSERGNGGHRRPR